MPKIHELVEKVAAKFAEVSEGKVWFTKLDFNNALNIDNVTSQLCSFSKVGGDITGP